MSRSRSLPSALTARIFARLTRAFARRLRGSPFSLGLALLWSVAIAEGAVVNATFNSATDVAVTASGYTATGNSVNLALNFQPQVGTELTVVNNTALPFISGTFSNLAQGQVVPLTFGGTTYKFVANYYGGTGNDLVLVWADNRAFAWGYSGLLGEYSSRNLPVAVATWGPLAGKTITAVATGMQHSLALCSDGTLVAWGLNDKGQLGTNSTNYEPYPVPVYTGSGSALNGKTIVAITAGNFHSVALFSDGTVAAWGGNEDGEVGDDTTINRLIPTMVKRDGLSALGSRSIVSVKAGAYHTLALSSDGIVIAWGRNANAQLGDNTVTNRLYPIFTSNQFGSAFGTKRSIAIAAGNYHSMALCTDGTVAAWGANNDGQLGQVNVVIVTTQETSTDYELFKGSLFTIGGQQLGIGATVPGLITTYTETTERRVAGFVNTAAGLSALSGKTVVAIHAAVNHSLALCSDGTLAAWGNNDYGQLGDGTNTKRQAPVLVNRTTALAGKTVTGIGGGRVFSTALCSDGSIASWGNNQYGQLGDDSTTDRRTPVAVGASTRAFGERAVKLSAGSESILSIEVVASPLFPSMSVTGNNVAIANGTTAVGAADGTDFGVPAIGSPVVRTFTIKNDGPAALNLTGTPRVAISGANSTGFTVSQAPASGQIAAGSSVTFQVSFTATVADQRSSATVTIPNDDPQRSAYTFIVKGAGPVPDMSVLGNSVEIARGSLTPNTLDQTDFEAGPIGTPISRTFTIKNSGAGPLSLTDTPIVAITGGDAAEFRVAQQPTTPVAASGGTTTFRLTFTPAVVGKRSTTTVSIANNDKTKTPFTFAIAGSGPVPVMAVSGNNVSITSGSTSPSAGDGRDFGSSLIGTGITQTFTIRNSGQAALTLSGTPLVAITGANAADFTLSQAPSTPVAAGAGTTTFQLTFNPTGNGPRTATISIPFNDMAKSPFTFSVIGRGPTPSLNVSGNNVAIASGSTTPATENFTDFGTTAMATPVVRTFTLTNSDAGVLTLTGTPKVAVSGAAAARFTVTQPTAGTVAANGGTATFQISYSPSAIGATDAATISIASDDPKKPAYTFAIKGLGPVPLISVSGNSNVIANGSIVPSTANFTDFGTTTLGTPVTRTFTVANTGFSPLNLTGTPKVAVTGSAADFTVSQAPASPVAASGSTTFQVTFSPKSPGVRIATLTITSDDTTHTPYTFNVMGQSPKPPASGGRLFSWGRRITTGQGDSAFGFTSNPGCVDMTGVLVGKSITAVSSGNGFTAVLSSEGQVFAWGPANGAGQLGVAGGQASYVPVAVNTSGVLNGKTITAIAAGGAHTLALSSDGKLFAWGEGGAGQLGNGTTTSSAAPVAVTMTGVLAGKTVTAIAAGEAFSLALTTEGKVYAWGVNAMGQLGNNSTTDSSVPVAVVTSGALSGKFVSAISAGQNHAFVLTADNGLYGWGDNDFGQTNSARFFFTTPVGWDSGGVLAGKTVTAISCMHYATLVLTSDNNIYFRGSTHFNIIDSRTSVLRITQNGPIIGKTISAFAGSVNQIVMLTSDNKMFISGYGGGGELGNGTQDNTFDPVEVPLANVGALGVVGIPTGALAFNAMTAIATVPEPTTATESYATNEDQTLTVDAVAGVLGNDTGCCLAAILLSSTKHGTLNFSLNGSFTYKPDLNFNGTDSFVYDATTGDRISAPVTVTITVRPVNDAPVLTFARDTITIYANSGLYRDGAGFATLSQVPADEMGQTPVEYVVTSSGQPFFWSTPPSIDTNGTLVFAVAPGVSGTLFVSFSVKDNGGTANGGVDTAIGQVRIVVLPTNTAPVTQPSVSRVTVAANSGPYTSTAFATFSPGPANDSGQTLLNRTVTNNNNALFSVQPALSPAGDLTFTPATDMTGTAIVTVITQDSGGTVAGGKDTSTTTFAIVVSGSTNTGSTPNVAPTLTLASAAVKVPQNSSAYTGAGFATFSPGPSGESWQTLAGYTVTNNRPDLFASPPDLSLSGTLTFTPATNARGTATVTIVAQDSGGTANGGVDSVTKTFAIAVNAVNSAPSVTFASAKVTALKNSGAQSVAAFATFSPGPNADAGQQLLSYTLTNNSNALFAVQPAISNTGVLTFTPATDAVGKATVTVVVRDDGGTAGGGVDSSTATFVIDLRAPDSLFVVTNTADSGSGSLRQAVLDTNAAGGPVTILCLNNLGTLAPTSSLPVLGHAATFVPGSGNAISSPIVVGAGGSFDLDGATLTGSITLQAGGRLSGTGAIDGDLIIGPGGIFSPASGPGSFRARNAIWQGGGIYEWDISDGNGSPGLANDLLALTNSLTITATTTDQAVVKLKSFTAGLALGAAANFDATQSYQWPVARFIVADALQPEPTSARIVGFDGASFQIDSAAFANSRAGGRFSLLTTSTSMLLAFVPDNPPVPIDDTYSVNQGDTLTVPFATGLLINDVDADFSPVTISLLTNATNGTAVVNTNGSFTYTPTANFYGVDTFTYHSNDGTLPSSRDGTVSITVYARPVNTLPGAQLAVRNSSLRFTATRTPTSNAIRVADPDSTALTVDLAVTKGSLSLATTTGLTLSNGASGAHLILLGTPTDLNTALETLTYTPNANYSGPDTLTITTTDEGSRTNRGNDTVAITVAPPPAITSGGTASALYKDPFAFTVTATGVDVTFSATGLPDGLSINSATGAITGSPTVSGLVTATITATDAGANTATAPLAITIAKRTLTVSGTTANNRIYDATTTALLNTTASALVGVVSGDTVTLVKSGATGTFATKTVGTGKAVQVAGLALSGAHAVNYDLTQPATTADISAKSLTVAGITASNKTYDGTTAATLGLGTAALVGVVNSDAVTLVTGGAVGTFADANAGSSKTVQVAGLTLSGADASNYLLTQPTASATITPAAVSVVFSNLSHTYDGTPKAATVTITPAIAATIVYSNGGSAPINAGTYTVSVSVANGNYSGGGSATLQIAKASQTVVLTIGGGDFGVGSSHSLTATASSGLPVTISLVSGQASLSASSVTVTEAGPVVLRATQAGDANYLPATADRSFTGVVTTKTPQTIAFGPLSAHTTDEEGFTLSATASSGLPVSFTITSGPAMISGSRVSLTGGIGIVTVVASQRGDAVFAAAPDVVRTFEVTKAPPQTYFGDLVEDPTPAPDSRGELIQASGPKPNAKSGDIAAILYSGTRRGNILIVAPSLGLNVSLNFTLNPDGAYSISFNGATRALTLTGALNGTTLTGRIPALRVSFTTQVQAHTGSTSSIAGFYESDSLNAATGSTVSIVGANGQILVVANTGGVSTGALGTVDQSGAFNVSAPGATIIGSVDAPTTTVSGTIVVPGQAPVPFSGLAATTSRTDRLVNLSSRVRIGPAAGRTLITGFVIGGGSPKRVLLRAVGPALATFGVQGALANPRLQLFDGTGRLVLENDDWSGTDTSTSTTQVGAFALAPGSKDAALFTTLQPGAYTMHVSDGGDTGVALAEIYDASINPQSEYQRLINISTRGEAGAGENVLIGGFIVTGNAPKKVLIRGIGPALGAFGLGGTLTDPRLRVYGSSGLIAENDNWSAVATDAAAVVDAATQTGAFALTVGSKDSALILTLAPGAYTAQVGATDGTSTGVALVEIYEIPQ